MNESDAKKLEREDAKLAVAMRELMRLEAWKAFAIVVDRYAMALNDRLIKELPAELNAVERQEFLKGTIFGLTWARDLPERTVTGMKAQQSLSTEQDEDRHDED